MDKQLKILVVTNRYPNRYKPYAGIFVARHVALHRIAGLEVSVLTPGDSRQGLFKSTLKYTRLVRQALRAMLVCEFDLVHAHWELPSGLIGTLLSRWRKKPFVLTSHGAFVDDYDSQPWLIRILVRAILRRATILIAVGQQHKLQIQAVAELPTDRIRVINMGIWLPHNGLSKTEARAAVGLNPGERILIFLGNLEKVKGPDILVKAAYELLGRGCRFKLIICGQGPQESSLRKAIRDLALVEHTMLTGPILPGDVFSWLSAADVCAVPSRSESFGLVAVEAMACGTAVVASDVGGLSEKIQHGVNGFLVPPGDHLALAECLQAVLYDDSLREQVAEQGRLSAMAYDMRSQSAQVEQLYRELVHAGLRNQAAGGRK